MKNELKRLDQGENSFIKKSSRNYQFLATCLASIDEDINDIELDTSHDYLYDLANDSPEYSFVSRKFGKRNFYIFEIAEVFNPFLRLSYQLKKQQYSKMYGDVSELDLFHATKEENIPKICQKNFDWRMSGRKL